MIKIKKYHATVNGDPLKYPIRGRNFKQAAENVADLYAENGESIVIFTNRRAYEFTKGALAIRSKGSQNIEN